MIIHKDIPMAEYVNRNLPANIAVPCRVMAGTGCDFAAAASCIFPVCVVIGVNDQTLQRSSV